MIISFKYKFIFIKNYKTAGSSIETYIYKYLDKAIDIAVETVDFAGLRDKAVFKENLQSKGFDNFHSNKYKNRLFFAHMPIWLLKERLEYLNLINFKDFFKFAVVRNPFDLIVSDYYWNNNPANRLINNFTFDQILEELKKNKHPTFRLFNFNRISNPNTNKLMVDKVIKFENLNKELPDVFNKLKIPFNGKLEIFKKKSNREKDYKRFYNGKSIKLIEKIFWKEIEMFNYRF